jgi:hypothetical protein
MPKADPSSAPGRSPGADLDQDLVGDAPAELRAEALARLALDVAEADLAARLRSASARGTAPVTVSLPRL